MLASLTLPALAFLMGISGIPGLNALPGLRKAIRSKPQPTAADSLPPPWKSASRLAVEHDFLKPGLPPYGAPGPRLLVTPTADPRRIRVRVVPDSGMYVSDVEVGELRLGRGYRAPLAGFAATSMQRTFGQRWVDRSRKDVNSLGSLTPTARTGLQLKLPVALPTPIQSLLGPGGPALNVSGAENIRISGTSNWTNQETGILGQKRSLFPSLDMQQDLDIRLEGQLSDRVKVNLLQNSANQVPLANRIAINYRGDEDDLVQALDLGNTSLALPGTQYVSYSGRNEGLFGVKLATRFGPLDFTALASKQEGRSERASYSGGSSRSGQVLSDFDYVKGQYFLLYDPNLPNPNHPGQPSIYRIDDNSIEVYLDDGNYGNDLNTLNGRAMVDPDRALLGSRYENTPPDTAGFRGRFDLKTPGPTADYEILSDYYLFGSYAYKIIRLKQPITASSNACLAVRYRATPLDVAGNVLGPEIRVGGAGPITIAGPDSGYTMLKMLRAPRSLQRPENPSEPNRSYYDPGAPFEPVRELELKNFYQLNGFGIDATTFSLQIQKGRNDPPDNFARGPGDSLVSYIEVAGLDNVDESVSPPVRGHDVKVDGTLNTGGSLQSSTRYYVDYKNGILFFPDPRPFAPRWAPADSHYFDAVMDYNANRRVRFDGPRDSTNEANQDIYDKYSLLTTDAKYYLTLEYAAQRGGGDITLGKGSILEGTEVVTVNGERWTRDRDYTIDYDIGRLSLKRQLGPTDQLNVDYSYAPLFQQASKTLLGSAFRLEGRNRSLGGALLYESKGAQDLRPRLGEEPSRTLITDLNTEWRFKPDFLTRIVDKLPGVRTTTGSEFNVQAEVGASFPNPNTRNEVFLDDMEGVRDAVSLSLSALSWRHASPPKIVDPADIVLGVATTPRSILADSAQGRYLRNAEIRWYQPPNVVKEYDFKPTLTEAQGKNNPRQVLALTVPKRPANALATDKLWAGLTYPLDQVGIDLSRAQFIEIWVNDFRDQHVAGQTIPRIRGDHVKLHIDLGVVSEDQMRAPNRPPDGRLQSEDQIPRDRQLVVAGTQDEDTGYDGVKSTEEFAKLQAGQIVKADLTTASDLDPEGDNYDNPDDRFHDIDPRKFAATNGSEGNKQLFAYPETEDLDLNELVDQDESYYEYTIALDDTSRYLATDIFRDFPAGTPNVVTPPTADNGWRRFRIPINDEQRVQFGVPDLSIARHVRVWIEDLQKPDESRVASEAEEVRPLLMLGGIEIVGSRWLASDLTPVQRTSGTTMTLNSLNTLDNADLYNSPFDPGETGGSTGSYTRREQSMALEFTELVPGDTLEAYRTFSLDENYSRYGALRWFAIGSGVGGYANTTTDSLVHCFVRFSTDEKGENYYEIKRRLRTAPKDKLILREEWDQYRADLATIANLKLNSDYPRVAPFLYRAPFGADGDSIIIRGRPSFTRLRRISFGLINSSDAYPGMARTYPEGLLLFDELRATDVAKDVGYANRLLVNGRLANLMSYNVSWNSADANFLSVGQTRGSGSRTTNLALTSSMELHRFFEGTGIMLPVTASYSQNTIKPRFSAGDDVVRTGRQQELSETGSETRTITTSYTRNWGQRANPLLRYTLGGLTANMGRSETNSHNPTGGGRTTGTNAGVNWNVAPRSLLTLGHKAVPFKIYPLPERLYWAYTVSETKSESYTLAQDGSGRQVPSSNTRGRTAGLNFGADTRPVDLLRHHIEGSRALNLGGVPLDHIGFVNFGRLTQWRQNFDASWTAQRGSAWLRPALRWGSNYNQNNDLLSENLAVRAISNGQNATVNWTLPFDQLRRAGRPGQPGGGRPAPASSRPPGPGQAGRAGEPAPGQPSGAPDGPRPGEMGPGWNPEAGGLDGAPADSGAAVTPRRLPDSLAVAPPRQRPDSLAVAPPRPRFRGPSLRDLLGRIGQVQTDLSINRTSSYSRLRGTPSPLYLLGFSEDPGLQDSTGRMSAVNGNATMTGLDWRANGRTQVPLVFNSSLSVRGSYGDRTTVANGVVMRTRERRFPDLEVDYGKIADAIQLTRFLRSPQLRTGWGWSRSWDYQGDRKRQISQSSTHDLRPLLSMRGSLKNGTTADLSVNMRSTFREVTQLGLSTQRDKNTDVNFTLSRSYTQGQKVNLLGKTSTVRSSVNLSLATVYSRRTGETRIAGVGVQNQVDDSRLSVTGKGSYGFSSNVTGSAVLGYSGSNNHLQKIVRRSIRVELSAQFTF